LSANIRPVRDNSSLACCATKKNTDGQCYLFFNVSE